MFSKSKESVIVFALFICVWWKKGHLGEWFENSLLLNHFDYSILSGIDDI